MKTKQGVIKMQRLGLFGALLVALISGLIGARTLSNVKAAGSAVISLSPGSSSYTLNDTITTTVAINPAGTAAVGADVTITYDASKLTYQSTTQYTTPLDASLTASQSSGTVRVARATFGAGSAATFNYIQVVFKATGAGSANVSVGGSSVVQSGVDGSNMWNGSAQTVTYTVSNPPSPTPTPTPAPTTSPTATPAPTTSVTATPKPTSTATATPKPTTSGGGSSTPTPTTTSSGGGNSTPTPTPTPSPGYEDLVKKPPKIKINRTKKVVLNTETNRPVSAKLEFGLDGQLGLTTEQTPFSEAPDVEISDKYLVPGRTYTYKLVLTDEAGETFESGSGTFRARGFKIRFTVKDSKGNLVKSTDVKLHSEERTGTTDAEGNVTFEDVEAGAHTLTFKHGGKEQNLPVSVTANAETDANGEEVIPLQELTVVATASNNTMLLTVGGGITGLAVLGGALFFATRMMRQKKQDNLHRVPTIAEGAIPVAPIDKYQGPSADDIEANEDAVIRPSAGKSRNADSFDMPAPSARPGESIRPTKSDDDTNHW